MVVVVRDFILTVVKKDSVVSAVSEVKQRSESSQTFHFNSSESKSTVVSIVRYFILLTVN